MAQIQQHQASQLSFEAVYRNSYNLVLHKQVRPIHLLRCTSSTNALALDAQGHTLYNSVASLISNHLELEARTKITPAFPPSSSVAVASGSGIGGQQAAASNMAAAEAGQLFLDRVKEVWDDHSACMGKLKDVFKYMVGLSLSYAEEPS